MFLENYCYLQMHPSSFANKPPFTHGILLSLRLKITVGLEYVQLLLQLDKLDANLLTSVEQSPISGIEFCITAFSQSNVN